MLALPQVFTAAATCLLGKLPEMTTMRQLAVTAAVYAMCGHYDDGGAVGRRLYDGIAAKAITCVGAVFGRPLGIVWPKGSVVGFAEGPAELFWKRFSMCMACTSQKEVQDT